MKLSELTEKQVKDAVAAVRKAARECEDAAFSGNRAEAYAAAERAQHVAFELKQLFGIDTTKLPDAQVVGHDSDYPDCNGMNDGTCPRHPHITRPSGPYRSPPFRVSGAG